MIRLLCTAFTFLTRIPVSRWASGSPDALARATPLFPVVGWIVGGIGAGVFYVVRSGFPPLTAALFGIAATAIVTGCFHEDAFADVCDGFGGYEPKRRLEIMRDSRVGSFGVVGSVLLIAAKASLLAGMPLVAGACAFVAAHTLARWSSVFLLYISPYATDPSSLAKPLAANVSLPRLLAATILAIPAIAWFGWLGACLSFGIAIVLSLAAARFFRSWIGGLSGDALGATNQLCELGVYMVLFRLLR